MITIKKDPGYQPLWRPELTSTSYHEDKTAIGSSTLKTILKSPKNFRVAYEEPKADSEAFRFGRMFHEALLEPEYFASTYVQEPQLDARTKAGKEQRAIFAASILPNQSTISAQEFEKITGMVESVKTHENYEYLKNGIAERAGYYADPKTGILCKVKPDYFNPEYNMIIDVKTTQDCDKDQFARDIVKFRYDFQMAMYLQGTEFIENKPVKYGLFVVVEKTYPYMCAFYLVDKNMREHGHGLYETALSRLSTCIDTDTWSPYQTSYEEIALPTWALK
jgi:hypothetical protein